MPERLQGFKWLIRSSTTIFIGSAAGQAIGISATILLSRSLGLEAFGRFSILIGLISLSAGVVTNAFSRSQARFTASYLGQEDGDSLMGTLYFGLLASFLCSLALALFMAFNSSWISLSYLNDASMEQLLRVAVFVVPCISLTGCILQTLRGLGYVIDRILIESILRPILRGSSYLLLFSSLSLPLVIYLEIGILYLLLAVALVLLFFRSRPFHGARPRFDFREYTRFTLPLLPASAASQLTHNLPLLSLGWFNMVEQAALYAIGLRIAAFGRTLVMSLNSNFAPMISNYQGGGRMDELAVLFRKVSRILLIVTSAWVAACIVYASDILRLFGLEFEGAYGALVILAALTLPIGVLGPVTNMITMTGHSKVTMFSSVINLGLIAVLVLVLVPQYGAIGAAASVVLSAFFFQAYQAYWLYRLHRMVGVSVNGILFAISMVAISASVVQMRALFLANYLQYEQLIFVSIIFLLGAYLLLFIFTSRSERQSILDFTLKIFSKRTLHNKVGATLNK
tara:strand:+ start:2388 stop:3923 length:1536 start_codon:yes stop_codon:yes gene_type:complete